MVDPVINFEVVPSSNLPSFCMCCDSGVRCASAFAYVAAWRNLHLEQFFPTSSFVSPFTPLAPPSIVHVLTSRSFCMEQSWQA